MQLDRAFILGVAAYLAPTFLIAYFWHLVVFADKYDALGIYRADVIIPFGLVAMVLQGCVFSWAYPKLTMGWRGNVVVRGLGYGALLGVLSWTFTTLAVAAKHPMNDIPAYMVLETLFTVLQFTLAGPLIVLAHRRVLNA